MDEAREMNINDYLQQRFDNDLLVDVRDAMVFDCGSIPGAVNVPLAEIRRIQIYHNTKGYTERDLDKQIAKEMDT